MKSISRILLVLSALVAPNVILSTSAWFAGREAISIIFGIVAAFGVLFTAVVIHSFRTKFAGAPEIIVNIRRFNADFFSHIISYIPALLTFSLSSDVQLYTMLTFYLFYAIALSLSDVVVLNPLLVMLGWRFQSVTIKSGKGTEEVVLVSKASTAVVPGERTLICLSTFGLYLVGEDD